MSVRLQRAYEDPSPDEGYRVLVDRVWPRGRSREALRLDEWARDLGPSDELRHWFGHDPTRWGEFRDRYRRELAAPPQATLLDALADRARSATVTLVYGARDEEHNQARVIAEELDRRLPRDDAAGWPRVPMPGLRIASTMKSSCGWTSLVGLTRWL
jgi:uncharacterized protein YeaO (DUF488 family)